MSNLVFFSGEGLGVLGSGWSSWFLKVLELVIFFLGWREMTTGVLAGVDVLGSGVGGGDEGPGESLTPVRSTSVTFVGDSSAEMSGGPS